MMTVAESILLGALQGLTEFLPVSSSGHLVVARSLLGVGDVPVLYDVLLHLATLLVVLGVFRRQIAGIVTSLLRRLGSRHTDADRGNLRLALLVVIATAVTGGVGLGVSRFPEGVRNPRVVAVLFIVTGIILIASRFFRGRREYGELPLWSGAAVGLAQGCGVLPGISRSGITITASLAVGMSRERAAEYSFLISIPAIVGAAILKIPDATDLAAQVSAGAMVAGLLSALVVGLASLVLLLTLVRKGRLYVFSAYLIPLGIVVLIVL